MLRFIPLNNNAFEERMSETTIQHNKEIVTRSFAKENGLKYYFTGLPCKNGHIENRMVSNGLCVICINNRLLKYKKTEKYKQKEKRSQQSEKRKDFVKSWRENNRIKCCSYSEKWREKNKDAVLDYSRSYKASNKEKLKKYERERWVNRKEELSEKRKKHQTQNKDMWASYSRNRRAKLRECDGFHCSKDIENIMKSQNRKCANCKCDISKNYHVDHIVPLSLCGSNWPSNLQLLCPSCNSRKSNKHPIDWARENGRLL